VKWKTILSLLFAMRLWSIWWSAKVFFLFIISELFWWRVENGNGVILVSFEIFVFVDWQVWMRTVLTKFQWLGVYSRLSINIGLLIKNFEFLLYSLKMSCSGLIRIFDARSILHNIKQDLGLSTPLFLCFFTRWLKQY